MSCLPAVVVGMIGNRYCLYCGDEFTPKRRNSTCCSRWHSQAYSRFGRARTPGYEPVNIDTLPPCCQEWIAAGSPKEQRRHCPQHQVAQKMRGEELQWADRIKQLVKKGSYDQDWTMAGFTIN